ncbi:DUF2946 domain-containing protein [Klebsiella pneumoniae]|uniref:DUF2946 domain-containing protein n=1 Tax=Klebsiella pneumoniae TaxID=573 RepID=UPI00203D43E2|nr:DUF2946 domain-containing protein [Klebsiella pneumoniae]HBT4924879.1 DUF2946 domain-containing protein [Klebsiella pneumoniae]
MLFVAPVISKSISHHTYCEHHRDTAMNMSDMHHSMMMVEPCQTMSDRAHRMMSGQAMSPMEEIACGYCQLLIHLPFVLVVLTTLLWLLLLLVQRSPVPHAIFLPVLRTWPPQQARAPPAVVFAAF